MDKIAEDRLMAAAPEMLRALKNIVASAPIKGLPLALEIDIEHARTVINRAQGRW